MDWTKVSKWKIIKEQNIGYLNLDTSHTFNNVFDHIKERMTDITTNLFNINLRDVEIPQADPSYTRTNYKPKVLLDSSYLPRAVVMYNIDVNQDPIASIPSMNMFNRVNFAMTYNCCTIKQPRLTMPDGQWFDYMKDIDFSVVATPKYSTASIFWSVLVNEQPLAMDLVKQFKFHFPINETNPIYNGFTQLDPPFGPKIEKPYVLEAYLPRQMVDKMLNMFQINDTMLLSKILQQHSHNKVDYKIHSGASDETYADLAVRYPSPIYITPTSIDLIENTDGNLKYYGVKIELLVNYMDLSTFRLSHSMQAINKDHPSLFIEKPDINITHNSISGYVPVLEANFTQLINGTTIWDYYKLDYTEDDIDQNYDEDTNKLIEYLSVNIKDLPQEFTVRQYINYIIKSKCNLNRSAYFNIEAKRVKRGYKDPWVAGTEAGFTIDYDKFRIIDNKGKVGDSIYVAIYINKEHYNKWLVKSGYSNRSNITANIGG